MPLPGGTPSLLCWGGSPRPRCQGGALWQEEAILSGRNSSYVLGLCGLTGSWFFHHPVSCQDSVTLDSRVPQSYRVLQPGPQLCPIRRAGLNGTSCPGDGGRGWQKARRCPWNQTLPWAGWWALSLVAPDTHLRPPASRGLWGGCGPVCSPVLREQCPRLPLPPSLAWAFPGRSGQGGHRCRDGQKAPSESSLAKSWSQVLNPYVTTW